MSATMVDQQQKCLEKKTLVKCPKAVPQKTKLGLKYK